MTYELVPVSSMSRAAVAPAALWRAGSTCSIRASISRAHAWSPAVDRTRPRDAAEVGGSGPQPARGAPSSRSRPSRMSSSPNPKSIRPSCEPSATFSAISRMYGCSSGESIGRKLRAALA